MAVILPFAAVKLSSTEFLLWQLLVTLQTLILLFDLGVTPTFIRTFAYAHAGRTIPNLGSISTKASSDPILLNVQTAAAIWATLRPLLRVTTAAAMILGTVLAGLVLHSRIVDLSSPVNGWCALLIVTTTTPVGLLALGYSSLVQGLDHVAELRRWEALTGSTAMLLQIAALMLGTGLLGLVVAAQSAPILALLRNITLANKFAAPVLESARNQNFNQQIWEVVWPATWRSGVGSLCATGFVQATGLVCDAWSRNNPALVSSYLLGLRLITAIAQFSQAPFYSRLPRLSRLMAGGNEVELVRQASRGMLFSYVAFTVGVAATALAGPLLESAFKANASFPSPLLWWTMVVALYAERVGAMHLQLFSLTNRIYWHIANGITGVIAICALFLLLPAVGVIAFPLAYLLANLFFYTWFSLRLSHTQYNLGGIAFELRTSIAPAVCLLIGILLSLAK